MHRSLRSPPHPAAATTTAMPPANPPPAPARRGPPTPTAAPSRTAGTRTGSGTTGARPRTTGRKGTRPRALDLKRGGGVCVVLSQIGSDRHRFRGLEQLNADGADCCGDESILCEAKESATARRAHVWSPLLTSRDATESSRSNRLSSCARACPTSDETLSARAGYPPAMRDREIAESRMGASSASARVQRQAGYSGCDADSDRSLD